MRRQWWPRAREGGGSRRWPPWPSCRACGAPYWGKLRRGSEGRVSVSARGIGSSQQQQVVTALPSETMGVWPGERLSPTASWSPADAHGSRRQTTARAAAAHWAGRDRSMPIDQGTFKYINTNSVTRETKPMDHLSMVRKRIKRCKRHEFVDWILRSH